MHAVLHLHIKKQQDGLLRTLQVAVLRVRPPKTSDTNESIDVLHSSAVAASARCACELTPPSTQAGSAAAASRLHSMLNLSSSATRNSCASSW